MRRWGLRLIALVFGLFTLTVLAVLAASAMMFSAHHDGRSLTRPVDAVVVLGGGGDRNWAARDVLDRRLIMAARLYALGKAPVILSSGGGIPAARGVMGTAQAYRARLIELGVPGDAILLEGRSQTTFENLRFTADLLKEHEIRDFALVTDAFHLPRALVLAEWFTDGQAHPVAAPDFGGIPLIFRCRIILREALAWWYNAWKLIVWELLGATGVDETRRGALIR